MASACATAPAGQAPRRVRASDKGRSSCWFNRLAIRPTRARQAPRRVSGKLPNSCPASPPAREGKLPNSCPASPPAREGKNWGTWIRTMTNWFRASRATVTPFPKKSAAPLSHSHSRLGPLPPNRSKNSPDRRPPVNRDCSRTFFSSLSAGHSRSNGPRCRAARRVWGDTGGMITPGSPCRRNRSHHLL